ncbi:MAG: peroxiredoxin-like family protein [Ilumatobacter sp.]|uniref:AhpC/TSA family protein n=1 Tax=Ilumatobacter sp. TaxID=1967498 RepID=UPI003C709C4F
MSDRLDEIAGPRGERSHVALITFTTPDEVVAYQQRRRLPFPILVDAERDVYDAYGMGRGSFLDVWGWRALRRYFQILRPSGPGSRRDLQPATEDTRQLGGDMVIAPDGRLAWGHWSVRSTDRPSVDDIVHAVTEATAATRP